MPTKIGTGFSYASLLTTRDATIQQFCMNRYNELLPSAQQLSDDYSIFLDTNVLLGYYLMPWEARQKLYAFLEQNKHRIYICDQVKREFKKHKYLVIKEYESFLVLNLPTEKQRGLTKFIAEYLDENDDVLAAYPDFKKSLEGLRLESEHILKLLAQHTQFRLESCRQLLLQQDIETILPHFQQLPTLEIEAFEFLKNEFKQLRAEAEAFPKGKASSSIEAYLYRQPEKVFPGMCDIKTKPKTPYGDYFIFHEMIQWAAENKPSKPIIFLTNDVTKSDWMDSYKNPYPHYLETFYHCTNDILYVLHADNLFDNLFKTNCQHLIASKEIIADLEETLRKDWQISQKLTPQNFQNLLIELYPYREDVDEDEDYWLGLIEDLEYDGFSNLFDLKTVLLMDYHLLVRLEIDRLEINDRLDAVLESLEI